MDFKEIYIIKEIGYNENVINFYNVFYWNENLGLLNYEILYI